MKNVLLIAGALISCLGGASLGACSSSSTGTTGTGASGSSTAASTSGTTGSGGTTASSTTATTGSGGAASSTTATTTTTGTGGSSCTSESEIQGDLAKDVSDGGAGTATIYCPFSGVDGGKNIYCDNGTQHCCAPSSGTSTCVAAGTACTTGDMDWGCEAPTDCGGNTPVCCAAAGSITAGTGTCENKSSGITSTACAAACTGLTICNQTSQCPTGKTCVAFEKGGAVVGACQ
jgi:hypothetical protein